MKITIIGAGIAGLSTAIALRKYRPEIKVEIYEGSTELKPIGAGLVLAANAVMAFGQLGVQDKVLAVGKVLEHFEILDATGRVLTRNDNLAINRNLQTISNFAVHRADLHRVLLEQLPGVPVHLGKKAADFRQDGEGVIVRFADGTETCTDYVLATDGIHSVFRKKLLPQSQIRYAGYTCWRGVTERTGQEDFPSFKNLESLGSLGLIGASETMGLGKRFGIVPLTDGRIYWFACLNAAKQRDERMAVFGKKELLDTFGDLHSPIPEIIRQTDPAKILWNDIIDFAPVQRFAFDRVLLLGDAAHATTPNMGQGACQAIEGAAIFGKTIAQQPDLKLAFKEFEQKRLKRTALIVNRSWALGKIAQLANPLAAKLRNFAFRMIPESMNERQVRALVDVEF
jgi:2-polyprenyl-6-methoxyphenol hydroxylase-like FAD-dependent oxidoreductase